MMSPKDIIATGALKLDQLSPSPAALHLLRQAFSNAISSIMICATVAICLAVLTTLGMQRLNLRNVSQDREAASGSDPVKPSMIILGGDADQCSKHPMFRETLEKNFPLPTCSILYKMPHATLSATDSLSHISYI